MYKSSEEGSKWKILIDMGELEEGKDQVVELNISDEYVQWKYIDEKKYEDWISLKKIDVRDGSDGQSAYEIYLQYHPEYRGNEEQWINDFVSGNLNGENNNQEDNNVNIDLEKVNDYLLNDPQWQDMNIEPLISKDTRFLLQRITNEILSTSVTSGSSYPRYILLFNYDFVHNVKYLKKHYNLYLSLKNNMDIDIF